MARKYKRDKSGRFAGGGGTKVSSSGAGGSRPKAATGRRQIPKKGSAAMAQSRRANPSGQRFLKGAKSAGKTVGKFVKKNPEVVGLALSAGVALNGKSQINKMFAESAAARKFVRDAVSDKRGIGGKPGANLRASKKNLRGAYKIRST
jgi:hypothetical protein